MTRNEEIQKNTYFLEKLREQKNESKVKRKVIIFKKL